MGHVGTSIVFTRAGILVVLVIVASGLLGFLDDYLAIRNERNLGLNKRGKFVGQLVIAGVFARAGLNWVHTSTDLSFTRFSLPGWNLTAAGWFFLAVFVIIATSNAVNLTDGLDGLAAGSGDLLLRRALHHRLLAVSPLRRSTVCTPRSTWRSSPSVWSARASGSCGGTLHPRASSWVTPVRWRSAPGSARSVC